MSYYLMVFNKKTAPNTRPEFMEWYKEQIKWTEGHSYDDPANTSPELRNWFMEMKDSFPPLNGPFSKDENIDDKNAADYSIGQNVIYVAFAWAVANDAHYKMFLLAQKYGVGFFDVSSDNSKIFFPVGDGKMKSIDDTSSNQDSVKDKVNKKEGFLSKFFKLNKPS